MENRQLNRTGLRNAYVFGLICASALFILLANLGVLPLWGSEGRWAVIARSMLTTGNIFNPQLGNYAYWDKPLLSYWQILPGAYLLGGVNEFAARLPSVIWALVMLVLTYDLAKRALDIRTGLISAILLGSTYGFIFWGRNAQVEMTNAGIILLALWYFMRHKSDQGHTWIFVLGIIMAIGSHMKGLPAFIIPVFCIIVRSMVKRDWSWLPPIKILIPAIVLSAGIFLCLFLAASVSSSSWEPFQLAWKENVVRLFQPYDHKAPFYLYCYRIFDLAAPWSLFLPLTLFALWKDRGHRKTQLSDILLFFGTIFLFFTLAGTRRPYYLLPILPFVAILVGDFLAHFLDRDLTPALDRITQVIGLIMATMLAIPLMIFIFKPDVVPKGMEGLLPGGIVLFLSAIFIGIGFVKRHVLFMILPVLILWGVFVLAGVPQAAKRPGNIRIDVAKVAQMHKPVAFLGTDDAKTIFYLNTPYEIIPDIQHSYTWARHTHGILITYDSIPDPAWECLIDRAQWKAYTIKNHPTDQ